MVEENRKKRRERLKWEYLKRSDDYRELCEWHREKAKNLKLVLPDKFQPATGHLQDIKPINLTYAKYKNIYITSFDTWYFDYYGKDGEDNPLGSVDDLSGTDPSMRYFMRNTFTYIINRCKRVLGREPSSFLEMADLLCSQMRMEGGSRTYLTINQSEFTAGEAQRLADEVKKILMKRVPRDRLREKELKIYLEVYDMRKEKRSDDDIKRKIYKKVDRLGNVEGGRSRDNKGEKDVTDEISKYYRYAEKIIKNSEIDIYSDENIFPGKYWE